MRKEKVNSAIFVRENQIISKRALLMLNSRQKRYFVSQSGHAEHRSNKILINKSWALKEIFGFQQSSIKRGGIH